MNQFDRLDAAFAVQFGALPPITPPVSLADAAMNQQEAIEGVCVEGDCDAVHQR